VPAEAQVSVIVPVFNGERYLAEALGSVRSQSYSELELIVVDDGSTDSTPDILRTMGDRVRCVRRPHAGVAAALNHGVELARGAFLSFLDADDLWVPEKLALQMAALEREPELDLAFGHVRQFRSPELTRAERAAIVCPELPMRGISTGTLLIRRHAFARVGPFDTGWAIGEFMDWYARAMEAGLKATVLPEVLMLRRLHTHHTRATSRAEGLDYARIARAALRRRGGRES
jgi:glycosyltransferase involved in cell wall biosynthesis